MDDDFVVAELDLLAKLGPRFPGSDAHERLVAHVAGQWAELGMDVREESWASSGGPARRPGWSAPDGRRAAGGDLLGIPVFRHDGPDGVRGRLRHLRGPLPRWSRARGAIAVVEIRNRELPASAVVGSWDPDDPWGRASNPMLPATLVGLGLKRAARAGVKGVVLALRGVSAANARGQYAPFTLSYRGIPAVSVAGAAADAVLHAAQRGAPAELVLDATLTKDASMRTVWAAVEGTRRPEETVLVVSHSDGTNVVEENGHIACSNSLATWWPTDRADHRVRVYAVTCASPQSPQGTARPPARWLADHPAGGPVARVTGGRYRAWSSSTSVRSNTATTPSRATTVPPAKPNRNSCTPPPVSCECSPTSNGAASNQDPLGYRCPMNSSSWARDNRSTSSGSPTFLSSPSRIPAQHRTGDYVDVNCSNGR